MRTNYIPVLTLDVFHSYFERDICSCIQFIPDKDTTGLFKRFGFITRSRINGFGLYSNTSRPLQELFGYMASATGISFFDFDMITGPDFNLITEVSPDWNGQYSFDSSDNANRVEAGVTRLHAVLSEFNDGSPAGKLRIHYNDIIPHTGQADHAQFSIRFQARATQWKYYVINKSAIKLNDPVIKERTGIALQRPENVTTQDGQQALLFSSGDQLLALSDKPRLKFDLFTGSTAGDKRSSQKQAAAKVIFKGLPCPDPSRIESCVIEGKKQLSSPMYVYI